MVKPYKRKILNNLKGNKLVLPCYQISNKVKSCTDENVETSLTPLPIDLSPKEAKRKNILVLRNVKKRKAFITKILSSKGNKPSSRLHLISSNTNSYATENIKTLLTPVQIKLSSGEAKRKNVLVLRNAKKGDTFVTKMLISKSNKIADLIINTNSRLLNLHNNGKIDLSGKAF